MAANLRMDFFLGACDLYSSVQFCDNSKTAEEKS